MISKIIGGSLMGFSLAVGAATAQTAGAPGAAQPPLVAAAGVGGCIFRSVPTAVSNQAVQAILSHTSSVKILEGPVAAAAPKCTGRPYSASDAALVGSVMSVYSRMVAAFTLGRQTQLPERQLYAAWASATPDEKAPFIASAQTFLRPGTPFAAARPEAASTFVERLALGAKGADPTVQQLVHMYYSAMALNQLAEADLAARGGPATP